MSIPGVVADSGSEQGTLHRSRSGDTNVGRLAHVEQKLPRRDLNATVAEPATAPPLPLTAHQLPTVNLVPSTDALASPLVPYHIDLCAKSAITVVMWRTRLTPASRGAFYDRSGHQRASVDSTESMRGPPAWRWSHFTTQNALSTEQPKRVT